MPERQKSSVGLLLDGLKAPLRGVDFLLRHPTLMRYALAPFVLSLVLLLAMLFVTF
ncbi:MAG: hypothetical protein HY303_05210 [Candidatus Wallbacteria bacterium]|nr:hypothetical protein [Candidatus Wallbacteria bacterium]